MLKQLVLRRKLRAVLALSGVALGIAAMVSLVAITQGTIAQYERMAAKYRGDVMIQRAGAPDPALSQVDPKLTERFKELPQVSDAHAVAFYAIKILSAPGKKGTNAHFFVITGIAAQSALLKRHHLLSGRYFTEGSKEAILGDQAAADLGLGIGDNLKIDQGSFKIVGLYRSGVRVMDKGALMSLSDVQFLRRTPNVNLLVLDLKEGTSQAASFIAESRRLFPDLEPMISSEVLDNFDQVRIFRNVSFGISVIAIAIAILGILNTMIMSVHERTREIGILRAIGWSKRMVLRMIFSEGLVIAGAGGILGIGVGVAGAEVLMRTLDIGLLDASYPGSLFAGALAAALAVGAIGSFLPALRATRITPLEALRHE